MAFSIVSVVLEKLNSLINQELRLLLGVKKQIEELSSTLSTIQTVLEDAEQKQPNDKALQNWLRKLKHAAYEADDILDDVLSESLRAKEVRFSHYNVGNLIFRHKIGKRIKEIKKKFDGIAKERRDFHLSETFVDRQCSSFNEKRETTSVLTKLQPYGRDGDKKKIIKVLVDDVRECENVTVYPIVGIGGLGKTTLAQMVFQDEDIKRHFELRIWVYVSEDFDLKRLMRTMIECVHRKAPEISSLESLQQELQDIIKGKRYLIVLDDVWSDNQTDWTKLKSVLACGSKGASVIATTRLENVALIMKTLPPHCLSTLSDDDCWLLFEQSAFADKNEKSPNLVAIGKEIVKKCGGVPLAVEALGGLLRFKSEEKEWIFIKESQIWNLAGNDQDSILPSLKLSYYNLSLELRQCFAFCAVFLKGREIEKENLILLWMASGLIPSSGAMELEDNGDRIWNELYLRSFFQDVNRNDSGRITFKMHDLIHDLARFIMKDELHIMEAGSSNNIPKQGICHLTFVFDETDESKFSRVLHGAKSVRTILQQFRSSTTISCGGHDQIFIPEHVGSLRVVGVRGICWTKLPFSIDHNLKHLRYLDLSYNRFIRTLPESICSLLHLQTLMLNGCVKLERLPKKMKYLKSLRHLYLEDCDSIDKMPPHLGQLTLLKTLSLFVAGTSEGQQLAELENLDLEGELHIKHLERVRNSNDARLANLIRKSKLRIIKLSWGDTWEVEFKENVEEILEALEPPPNIEVLRIENYGGMHFPNWQRSSSFQNVTHFYLKDCRNCPTLPALEQFPSLESLDICNCPNLKGLRREERILILPRLRSLFIEGCPNMSLPHISSSSLPDQCLEVRIVKCNNVNLSSISNPNRITSLYIYDCNGVISFPENLYLTALECLSIWRCDVLESLPELGPAGSLKRLAIENCLNLSSLPDNLGHVAASLESLTVRRCPKLVALPESIKHLNSLKSLYLSGFGISMDLPDGLQHIPPILESLSIWSYSELTSLPEWLENHTSLRCLEIGNCPKIVSLPARIQSLTNLETLWIEVCNAELASRCEKETGEDWQKIAHIPHVQILGW